MGRITIDQSHQIMATLAVNTAWDEIDFEEAGLQDSIIRNPKLAGRQFTYFLQNGGRFAEEFSVWTTVKLGTGLKTGEDFCRALKAGGFKIGDTAEIMLVHPESSFRVTTTQETKVDLVKITTANLGFRKQFDVRRDQIYERAKELGLELCPAEVGPQLRLQYKYDVKRDWWVYIGMDPISIRSWENSSYVFKLQRVGDHLCLFYDPGKPDYKYWVKDSWVFVLPRK